MTTAHGQQVGDNQNSLTAGPRGLILLQDYQLLERMATFNRERLPERSVHAKGSGAFGMLTITNDITRYSKAKVFSKVGKQNPCLLCYSTVAGERGATAKLGMDLEKYVPLTKLTLVELVDKTAE